MERTVNEIVRRHEIFRTTYATLDEALVQVVSSERRCEVQVNDFTLVPASERAQKVNDLLRGDVHRPFNLSSDLMLRPVS